VGDIFIFYIQVRISAAASDLVFDGFLFRCLERRLGLKGAPPKRRQSVRPLLQQKLGYERIHTLIFARRSLRRDGVLMPPLHHSLRLGQQCARHCLVRLEGLCRCTSVHHSRSVQMAPDWAFVSHQFGRTP